MEEKMKYKLLMAFTLLSVLLLSGCAPKVNPTREKYCRDSGGTVTTASCCRNVGNFPNTCLTGACGCSPVNSHTVYICHCPQGECFDGTECVTREQYQ